MSDKFFITTAISYPNGQPHIGHAYEIIATDVIARYHRLTGHDVLFSTGTDDHGQKMLQTARAQGLSPQELADKLTPIFRELADRLNCSHDDFIRTSEPRHYQAARDIWQRIAANGDIYKDNYAGWYSVRDEAFYTKSEVTDDEAGKKVSPQGTAVEWLEEESYFFRLSAYGEKLLAHYEQHPEFLQPESAMNEVKYLVKNGLKDLSISRTSFDWGVPVPDDPAHVMYVWMDALTNYLSVTGYPDKNNPKADFWPAALHVIGKDITRFHAVYWPAFLLAAGLPLPKRIFAHGFLTVQGKKMSKSTGNVVDPFVLADYYGVDALRYFFLREVPFGRDGSFNDAAIVNRVNADLANDLGNLAQRCLSMIAKNCAGKIPEAGDLQKEDMALLNAADGMEKMAKAAMETISLHHYVAAVMDVVSHANRYFAAAAPWVHKTDNPARMGTILYCAAETVRQATIILQPVIPEGAAKLLDQLGVAPDERHFACLGAAHRLSAKTPLSPPQAVFPKLVAPATDASNTIND